MDHVEPAGDYELDKRYAEMLDECYEPVKIVAYEYDVSSALKAVDPVAYRCGFNDWVDAECKEGNLIEFDGEIFEVIK